MMFFSLYNKLDAWGTPLFIDSKIFYTESALYGILYFKKPDGELVDVLRYFKENEAGSDPKFVEISESEYIDRKMIHRDRIKKQKKTLEGDIVWPLAKTMTIKKK